MKNQGLYISLIPLSFAIFFQSCTNPSLRQHHMHILCLDHWTHSQLNLAGKWRDVLLKSEAGQKHSTNPIGRIMESHSSSTASSSSGVQISTSFIIFI